MVPNRRTTLSLIALLLFLGTLLLYYPALRSGFVNYDDPDYVTSNFHVQQGLTKHSVAWAFTSTAVANWHPLTWLSHMLDVQLFGLKPAGHHAQSVFWHALNVVLLFLLLAKATGFIGRSAIVAALFAVHPLNVESLAWVAERKNVLCTFFLLLALATYGWYVKRPRASRYLLVALLFALGLMAKPLAITLPCALLLVDFWPLQRFPDTPLSKLALEKIPLLALSAASAAITLYAQRAGGALGSFELLPLAMRVKNAICSYLIYMEKAVWPSRLLSSTFFGRTIITLVTCSGSSPPATIEPWLTDAGLGSSLTNIILRYGKAVPPRPIRRPCSRCARYHDAGRIRPRGLVSIHQRG